MNLGPSVFLKADDWEKMGPGLMTKDTFIIWGKRNWDTCWMEGPGTKQKESNGEVQHQGEDKHDHWGLEIFWK